MNAGYWAFLQVEHIFWIINNNYEKLTMYQTFRLAFFLVFATPHYLGTFISHCPLQVRKQSLKSATLKARLWTLKFWSQIDQMESCAGGQSTQPKSPIRGRGAAHWRSTVRPPDTCISKGCLHLKDLKSHPSLQGHLDPVLENSDEHSSVKTIKAC